MITEPNTQDTPAPDAEDRIPEDAAHARFTICVTALNKEQVDALVGDFTKVLTERGYGSDVPSGDEDSDEPTGPVAVRCIIAVNQDTGIMFSDDTLIEVAAHPSTYAILIPGKDGEAYEPESANRTFEARDKFLHGDQPQQDA